MVLLVVLKLFCHNHLLRIRKCGRNIRSRAVPGRNARRSHRDDGTSLVARLYRRRRELTPWWGWERSFAGIVRAPMTSVPDDLRDDSRLLGDCAADDLQPGKPLHLAAFSAGADLEALAEQDGIHLPSNDTREELGRRTVLQVMRGATETLPAGLSVQEALARVQGSEFRSWVVDDDGSIVGVLNQGALDKALANGEADQKLASLFKSLEFPHVHPDQPLHLALERMSTAHLDILPVVGRADIYRMVGVVTLRDVLDSYGVDTTGSA